MSDKIVSDPVRKTSRRRQQDPASPGRSRQMQPARTQSWAGKTPQEILSRYQPGTAPPLKVLEVLIKLFISQHTALEKTVSHKTRQERAQFLRRFFCDLKQKAGIAALKRIAATVDVFVTNIRPDAQARLGVDADSLRAAAPRLIHCSITGFGSDGPYAGRPAYDTVIQGVSGVAGTFEASTGDPRYVIGDYGLLNARLTLSDIPVGPGNWRLSLFGKNLTDTEYYIAHFNGGLPAAIFGDPRTYGLELTFEY